MTPPPPPSEDPWRDTCLELFLGASHEFNNKLTAIVSLSDLFLNEVGHNHPMASGLSTMRETAYSISEVLHQLTLHYFAQPGRPELVDLNATVREVAALVRRCVSSRIEVVCEIYAQPLPTTADAVWLRRVLLMLAIVATQRMPETGTVTLRTSGEAHAAVAFAIGVPADRPLVVRGDAERAALGEAARFADAHRGKFKAADHEFVLTLTLEDLR
jgi:signal transduction histidine kinase